MRLYLYLHYRIFRFYKDVMNENQVPLFYTNTSVTTLLWGNLFTVDCLLSYLDINTFITSVPQVIVSFLSIWILNYLFIVRKKIFLNFQFKKNKLGGYAIIFYFILTFVSFLIIATLNRAKLGL